MADKNLQKLIQGVALGNRDAFRLLYDATSAKLFGVAIRILRRSDLAEDVVQDTFLKVWQNAGNYRPEFGAPMGWMVTITRNRAIDVLRKHTESRLDDDKNDEAEDLTRPDPFAAAAENADLRAFLDCLGKLDSKHQTCILEAYYYGYTHDEIAERNATPVGTVKSWIRRGLARIKECLDHD